MTIVLDNFVAETAGVHLTNHTPTGAGIGTWIEGTSGDAEATGGALKIVTSNNLCFARGSVSIANDGITGYVDLIRGGTTTGGDGIFLVIQSDSTVLITNSFVQDNGDGLQIGFIGQNNASIDLIVRHSDGVTLLQNVVVLSGFAIAQLGSIRIGFDYQHPSVDVWTEPSGGGTRTPRGSTVTLTNDFRGNPTRNRVGLYQRGFVAGGEHRAFLFEIRASLLVSSVVDAAQSTVTAVPTIIEANGVDTSTITVQLVNPLGVNIVVGGDTVVIFTDFGSIGAVTDNNDGTYTATLTSAVTPGLATLTATVNTILIGDDATVQMTEVTQEGIMPLNIVRADAGAVGGAIDPESEVRQFLPFLPGGAEQISFVSDKASDVRSVIVRGMGTDGEEIAEKVKLQGTNTVTTARFFLKVFMIQTSVASDSLIATDPTINAVITITSTTLSDSITQGRVRLTNMLAYVQPMDFGTIVRYEKVYFFNNSGSTISSGATLTITDGSDGTLEWGLDLAKNDLSSVTSRIVAPTGIVFAKVATVTPVDLLANDFHGLWIKQTLTRKQRLTATEFQFVNPITTLNVGMEPLDRVYDQIVAL